MYIIVFFSCYPFFHRISVDNKSNYRVFSPGKSPTETISPGVEQLFQPLTLFPLQTLPYQYYQIVRGKFLLPSSFFLYNFFLSEYPFPEDQYKETTFKEKVFEEKGEYSL